MFSVHFREAASQVFPRKVMGDIIIVLSDRHFLIYVVMSEWGSLLPCFVEYNIPPVYIIPHPSLVHHFLTSLLVPYHS